MNNKQRYGIRKYSIGAASIALGTVAVIGLTDQTDAQASEMSGNQVIEVTNNSLKTDSETVEEKLSIASQTKFLNTDSQATSNEIAPEKIGKPSSIISNENKPTEVAAPRTVSQTQTSTENKQVTQGQDVSDKVTVEQGSIKGKDGATTINPHQAERVTLDYKLKFNDNIRQGDYFDIKLSNNVDTMGIGTKRYMPDIKDNTAIIATGYLFNDQTIRYTFSNYVTNRRDIKAQLSINLYFKPSVVLNDGNQTVSTTINNSKTESQFNVQYLNGVRDNNGMRINGRIDRLDKNNGTINHIAYINPEKKNMVAVSVTGRITEGHSKGDERPNIKIYKYKGQSNLAKSVYVDFNNADFEDVTNNMKLSILDGSYKLDFERLNGETYVIQYYGKYDVNAANLNLQTQLSGYYYYNNHYYYYPSTLTWDNGVQFYSNNASGSGKDKPSEPIIQAGQPIDLDYVTQETISGNGEYVYTEETEDTRPVEIMEDTVHGSNHATGVIEFEEDTHAGGGHTNHTSDVIEFEEETAKGIITGAVSDHTTLEDTMEYMTDNHLIEFEDENTLPPSISGHAEGVIEEIEDNHHIDIVEITTPEGETGHVEGMIDIVEDNYLIAFEEDTGNGEIKGEVNGTIEEIEDSNVIDMISEIGTENGSNNTTFEEDTNNDRPSVEEKPHNPIEIIEDTIIIEHGHTKGVLVEEDDTQPPHPNEPKAEQPDIPKTPENDAPKKDNELKPTPKVKEDSPRMDEEKEESPKTDEFVPTVVNEKPKFKVMSTISNKINNDGKAHVKHEEKHNLHEELPHTGSESGQQPILVAGLMSLIGLVLLKRRKRDI
ncbi:YSIRK signal domain/LPXTG anchor domain surface protein [Staphylococcus hyicus]|uniref:YSIRK signal domain/LPXTG anchor domain surface protein n=1 Tax=Staphylococcus hyicus TaxID=1284 RepID=UPI000580793D|nr:YSIRK signal domain/LPXTG anchor domain surface protein [Staphylococcus hyicus]AJC96575.1 fibronectin-binding protein [Staphylococcus hyicus]SQE48280.1 fibronectin-binding protein FnbB [Staphylococcus hyicus]